MNDFQTGFIIGITVTLIVLPLVQWWHCRCSLQDAWGHFGQARLHEVDTPRGMKEEGDEDILIVKFSHWIIFAPFFIGSLMAIGLIIGIIIK